MIYQEDISCNSTQPGNFDCYQPANYYTFQFSFSSLITQYGKSCFSGGEWKWTNQTCDNKFEFVCKTLREKVHGGWSEWTEWTACDRQFIRERSHVCNNPIPLCGGDPCEGGTLERR